MSARILIIGGGIGGLALAAALRRERLEAAVFEQAPAIREVGAGITLQPNALRALGLLGLAEEIARAGRTLTGARLCDARGRELGGGGSELGGAAAATSVGIHRGRLQEILLRAAGEGRVTTAARCRGFTAGAGAVSASFESGASERGAALVGCDGIRSVVRRQLLADGEPRYAGYTCWRGLAAEGSLWPRDDALEAWGRGRRFGIVPIGGGVVYWYATRNAPAGERDRPDGAKAELLRLFGDWCSPVPEIVAATPETAILRGDILDRPPTDRWGEGRVTLLGDAAHPMTPNLGQGACQAIEDALVLARELARAGDELPAALRRYEARRQPRTRWIVDTAERLGRIGQWQSPLACWLRDRAVALTPSAIATRTLSRAWRFDLE